MIKKKNATLRNYRHVGLAACVHCFGHRVDQVATDAEVTHFHLALSVDQNIGGLHIWEKTCRENDDGEHSIATMRNTAYTDN